MLTLRCLASVLSFVRPFASRLPSKSLGGLLLVASVPVAWVQAQTVARPDREQALTFDAGQMKIDGKRNVRILSGGVELTRGSFLLKASEVEVRDAAGGQVAVALAAGGQLASFRQKRDGLDETVEGVAERVEYEARSQTVRLTGRAVLRRYRAGVLSEEVSGQTIVYDHERETFEVLGGGTAGGANGGRVKGLVTPSNGGAAPTSPAAVAAPRAPAGEPR